MLLLGSRPRQQWCRDQPERRECGAGLRPPACEAASVLGALPKGATCVSAFCLRCMASAAVAEQGPVDFCHQHSADGWPWIINTDHRNTACIQGSGHATRHRLAVLEPSDASRQA